jgi:hypothetical protein
MLGGPVKCSAPMALRVLICVEDAGVAHVIVARLARDGVDGVVVDTPSRLVDEARKGATAVAVQHRYPTGEIGSSLLRQVRVARGEVVPAVVVVSGELSGPDRLVYERQYKVTAFLPTSASPVEIATAVRIASGAPAAAEEELELHEDEQKNEFDISIESQAHIDLEAAFSGAFDDDDDDSLKTVEISKAELMRLKGAVVPAIAPMTEEGSQPQDVSDVSRLPAPGGDNDFDIGFGGTKDPGGAERTVPVLAATSQATAWPASPGNAADEARPAPHTPPSVAPDSSTTAPQRAADEGDAMQIQELQRTQAELKKVLIAERKSRELAQKRVEELEQKLLKMGDVPTTSSQGVPTDGVFEDLRYPALLARFRAEAFTGALLMPSSGTTRTVYLKDGLPVAFSSSEPGQRIGKVLVSQGRITDEQYMKAATRMVEKSIKLTDALVELNLIDAESLEVEQRNLTRDQIIAGFEVVQGRFTTNAGVVPDGNTSTFDFGPGEIYVQGFRRYAPSNEMLAAFETLRDKYLVANARLSSYRPKLGLSGDDERLLRLLGEALTVEEAVERANLTPEQAARLLAALQALDLVEEWSPGVEQFRSRLRAERQRHAEELSTLSTQHRHIEDRLLKAFEQALAGRGDSSALSSTLSAARVESKEQKPLLDSRSASSTSMPSLSSASLSSASSSSGSSSSSTSQPALSSTAAASRSFKTEVKATVDDKPASSSRSTLSWESSTASPPPQATVSKTIDEPRQPLSSLASTLQSAMPPPAQPTPTVETAPQTPADKKYREGIEQAAQERLDEAEVTLREAVRLDATRPEFLTALARVLLANPRYERSGTLPVVRSLLDRAVTLQPDHAEASELHKQVQAEMGT